MHKSITPSSIRTFKNVLQNKNIFRNSRAASSKDLYKDETISKADDHEEDETNKKEKTSTVLESIGSVTLKTAAISGVVIGGIAVAVPLLGFTAGGVAAGSAAAAYQSAVLGGTIASGSAFATLQSVGAAGLAASTQAGIVAGSGVVAGAHTIIKKFKSKL